MQIPYLGVIRSLCTKITFFVVAWSFLHAWPIVSAVRFSWQNHCVIIVFCMLPVCTYFFHEYSSITGGLWFVLLFHVSVKVWMIMIQAVILHSCPEYPICSVDWMCNLGNMDHSKEILPQSMSMIIIWLIDCMISSLRFGHVNVLCFCFCSKYVNVGLCNALHRSYYI